MSDVAEIATPQDLTAAAATVPQRSNATRVVAIDILRGLAILWVIVFHLWGDMTYHYARDTRADLYTHFAGRILDGRWLAALTALGEIVLGQGDLGVTVFMMLSGLSLTMIAYQRGEPGVLQGYLSRARKVLPVYWGGVLLILATVAGVAFLQTVVDGGSFASQWSNVRIAALQRTDIGWSDVAWALTVGGWLVRGKSTTLPVGSLWFVELLLQYYLIFPFALLLLKKIGPWYFLLAGLAITLAARAAYLAWATDAFVLWRSDVFFSALAPFRGSEFFIGMGIGYLFVKQREEVSSWLRSPSDTAGVVLLGVALLATGVLVNPHGDPAEAFSEILIQLGLAFLIIPLLFKTPGRLEVTYVARALVFLGVVSFTALIVNDMMRYVASFLRYEGVTGPTWWFFLVVVYVPVGTLLAYPLAQLFGLLPKQRAPTLAAAPLPADAALPAGALLSAAPLLPATGLRIAAQPRQRVRRRNRR